MNLTLPLLYIWVKMFKLFRSSKVLSNNAFEHNFTSLKSESVVQMLCKFGVKKIQVLEIRHLNSEKVGATGFEPATAWSQTRSATGLRYTPNIT